MIDLSTTYLGLKLTGPLVISASPLTDSGQSIRRLEEAGAGAIVVHSLLERDVNLKQVKPLADTAVPDKLPPNNPGAYLTFLRRLKKKVSIPVMANLSGRPHPDWPEYAQQLAATGVDALEINIAYVVSDTAVDGANVEAEIIALATDLRATIDIPLAFKISPFFSAIGNVAASLEKAGVNGLVIFNRYFEPDFDVETQTLLTDMELSLPEELRLRLRWTAILSRYLKQTDLAVTGGVHTAEDVLKAIMAGARAAMMTSALLTHGIEHITAVNERLDELLAALDMPALQSAYSLMRQDNIRNPAAYERANYMRVLKSY